MKRPLAYLLLLIAYIVSGKLGLMLALPPGYASPIFPAAGIAVAAVFIGGRRVLPWILMASALLNVWTGYSTHSQLDFIGLTTALIIAFASTLQAAAGGMLFRNAIGYPTTLSMGSDILRFLFLAPVVCLISAGLSTAGLWVFDVVATADVASFFANWWVGDTLGVIVTLPLVMVVAGEPRELWKSRVYTVAIPLLLALLLFVGIFVQVSEWEHEESLTQFQHESDYLLNQVRAEMNEQESVIELVASFFLHSRGQLITHSEFYNFVQKSLMRYSTVHALSWEYRVDEQNRTEFENSQRALIPGFEIRERNPAGEMQRAEKRSFYYPVTYIEPFAQNEAAVGFDLTSEKTRKDAMIESIQQGVAVATAPLRLVQEQQQQQSILLLLAVDKQGQQIGAVSSVLRMGDFMNEILANRQFTFYKRLTDLDAHAVVYDDFPSGRQALFREIVEFGTRHYSLETVPTAAYLRANRGWQSWSIMSVGILSVGLMGALLLFATGYASRMKSEVDKRTRLLSESEAAFRAMVESIPLAIYVSTGIDQRGEYLNPEFTKLFGYTLEDIPSVAEWWPCAYPDEAYRQKLADEWQAKVAVAIETASMIEPMETIVTCKDGSKKYILWGHITRNEKNYAFGLDLTRRKQAERSMQKLAEVVKQAGEAALITDINGGIEYINPAFTELTGYAEKEVIGHRPNILKSGKESSAIYRLMWNKILSGAVWNGKMVNRKKDGSLYPAMVTISPIRNESGEITHFVGIQQDLSKYEELEQQFYQAQKMEALGTLVGGIAHEFNNALSGMTGNLYLAKKKTSNLPEVVRHLDAIETQAFRTADLIRSLLSFARKGMVQKTSFDLPPFIKEAIKMHRVSLPEKIRLSLDIEETQMIVNWDANLLHQVMMNLINNARDAVASVELPSIEVRVRKVDADSALISRHPETMGREYACISVVDNGAGIHADHLQRVFEPFFTTKEVGKGTGLGLSMVIGAVQDHNGFVDVDSAEGRGTAFNIFIPLVKTADSPVADQPEEAVKVGSGEFILLVDDEPHMLDVGRDVLEVLGYQVFAATDGLEAVEVFKAHQGEISLVLSDVMMPRLGGDKAVERIREIKPDIKVIFTTGYTQEHETLDMIRMNEIILTKPYNIEELGRVIRNLLDQS